MKYTKIILIYFIRWFRIIRWTINNWLIIWYLIEVCFVMFVGVCVAGKGYRTRESTIGYYLVQVIFSLVILTFILFYIFNLGYMCSFILTLGLIVKMGIFPFHFWLILICGKLEWIRFFILGTLIKLIPLILLYYLFCISRFLFIIVSSAIFGRLIGLNNSNIQKMMGYRSIINICWFIYSIRIRLRFFLIYFARYVAMLCWLINVLIKYNIFYVNQFKFRSINLSSKVIIFIYGLRISGFPPFLGFLIKWLVINYFWYVGFKLLIRLIILISILAVYFYLQLFFFAILVFSRWVKWYTINFIKFGLLRFIFLLSYFVLFIFY